MFSQRPLSQRESVLATLVLAIILMSGLYFANVSPLEPVNRLMVGSATAVYVLGIFAVVVFQRRHAEAAFDLFRVSAVLGIPTALLGMLVFGIARHTAVHLVR
jgi:hypothetical protein